MFYGQPRSPLETIRLSLYFTRHPTITGEKISLAGSVLLVLALAGAVYTETRKKKATAPEPEPEPVKKGKK